MRFGYESYSVVNNHHFSFLQTDTLQYINNLKKKKEKKEKLCHDSENKKINCQLGFMQVTSFSIFKKNLADTPVHFLNLG